MYAIEYILGNKQIHQKISRATHPATNQDITSCREVASDMCIRSGFLLVLSLRQLNVGYSLAIFLFKKNFFVV